MLRYIIVLFLLIQPQFISAQDTQYVFYLPGQIVEGADDDPESPLYGAYDYNGIVTALKGYGYTVISEKRSANTISELYARNLAQRVDSLKLAGIRSEQITVIGASKGALIAMMVSNFVRDNKVKYVFMGACNASIAKQYPIDLYGQILSIYEASDDIGKSCNGMRENSDGNGISVYKELMLHTGLRHGFCYKPLKEWIEPVTVWIAEH